MCIDLRNFMEDYGEKYELSDNPLLPTAPHCIGHPPPYALSPQL